ncbi:MAG TPA: hypothetical protein QGF58_13340 [Myxococcota bacterium]|nr:hypothetical protein [Myxococcota bacterium]
MGLILLALGCACEPPADGDFPEGTYNGFDGERLRIRMDGTGELQLGCTFWLAEDPIAVADGGFEADLVTDEYEQTFSGSVCGESVRATFDGRDLELELDGDNVMESCD